MYNTALCLRSGEGVIRNLVKAKRWMRRTAMAGHGKAMFEHGLTLFAEGEGGPALVFLELATRAESDQGKNRNGIGAWNLHGWLSGGGRVRVCRFPPQ